jgi:hypothetical protein
MPHSLALSGWPFYFLHLSTIKKSKKVEKVVDKIDQEKGEETDGNQFFRDSNFNREQRHKCANCCLSFTMEAGLLSISKLLMSVIGQPRGNLVTIHTPITQDFKISDTVLGLGINGKVVECQKKATGQKFALKVGTLNNACLIPMFVDYIVPIPYRS